ncbi:L,D-transpeptidase family protein [Thermodesulfobacteriota bacterium]
MKLSDNRSQFLHLSIPFLLLILIISCSDVTDNQNVKENVKKPIVERIEFEPFMDVTMASGFDFPVGSKDGKGRYVSKLSGKTHEGWYVATMLGELYTQHKWIHTGEDWNGKGGGNTDLGQPVFSIAEGHVIFADKRPSPWGNVILIKHCFMENGKLRTIFSQYSHLNKLSIEPGQIVKRREKIGAIGQDPDKLYPAHLHFEIRKKTMKGYPADYWPSSNGKDMKWIKENYEEPSNFIKTHRRLIVPVTEEKILIAIKHKYRMRLYSFGQLKKEYPIALSQNPIGHKIEEGDNRLPEGEYRIIQKSRGPFGGDYGQYYGPAWMRINYPNKFDAINGFNREMISKKERDAIIKANIRGKSFESTRLGGGIGIHGWDKNDWVFDGSNLTWGCISMHNKDIDKLYKLITINTIIVIAP